MTLPESWLKLKVLSQVVHAMNASTPTSLVTPQILDAKEVNWVTSLSDSGMACKTCIHYHLAVELQEGEATPPQPREDYSERDLIEMVKMPIYFGYCSKVLPTLGVLLYGIRSDSMCGYFEEIPSHLQFDDDVLEEDDGRTPVVATTVWGT